MNIEELEGRVEQLDRQLREAERELHAARVASYGISVGSIVTAGSKEFKVSRIQFYRFADKPWVKGNIRKKDGSWGTAERNLYSNWELKP